MYSREQGGFQGFSETTAVTPDLSDLYKNSNFNFFACMKFLVRLREETLIWNGATTTRIRRIITYSLPETVLVTLGFNPHLAPGAEDVVRRHRA